MVEFAFHRVRSDVEPKKRQCPGLNLVAEAGTSWVRCKHFSVLSLFVHSMLLNIDVNMIFSWTYLGFCTFKYCVVVLSRIGLCTTLHKEVQGWPAGPKPPASSKTRKWALFGASLFGRNEPLVGWAQFRNTGSRNWPVGSQKTWNLENARNRSKSGSTINTCCLAHGCIYIYIYIYIYLFLTCGTRLQKCITFVKNGLPHFYSVFYHLRDVQKKKGPRGPVSGFWEAKIGPLGTCEGQGGHLGQASVLS